VIKDLDVVLVAVGRDGNYGNLTLEKAGVAHKDVQRKFLENSH
jgi:pyruvate/2-oxoglutarate dehydrogenase complex dihydrolipoamide dehydrogenase (E3) component